MELEQQQDASLLNDASRTVTADSPGEQGQQQPQDDAQSAPKVQRTTNVLKVALEFGEVVNVYIWPNKDETLQIKMIKFRLYGHHSHDEAAYVLVTVSDVAKYFNVKNPRYLAELKRNSFESMIREFVSRLVVSNAIASRFGGNAVGLDIPGMNFDGINPSAAVPRRAQFAKITAGGLELTPLLQKDDVTFREEDPHGVKEAVLNSYKEIIEMYPKGKPLDLREALTEKSKGTHVNKLAMVVMAAQKADQDAEGLRDFYDAELEEQQDDLNELREQNERLKSELEMLRVERKRFFDDAGQAAAAESSKRVRVDEKISFPDTTGEGGVAMKALVYRKVAESITGDNFETMMVKIGVHLIKDLLPKEYLDKSGKRRKISMLKMLDADWVRWRDLLVLLRSDKLRLHKPPISQVVMDCCEEFCKKSADITCMSSMGVTTRSQAKGA